jgi:hypothetical protein
VDVPLLVELRGHRAAVLQRERDVALELDRDGHGDLAQPDAPAEDAGEGAGLALVVEVLQGQAVLARAGGQFHPEAAGGGGAQDCDLGAFHAPSWGER